MVKTMCNIPDDILEKLQKDISEIKVALLGNEYNPEGGLLYRMKEAEEDNECLEKRIRELEDKIKKIYWTASGAAALATTVFTLLFKLKDILTMFSNG